MGKHNRKETKKYENKGVKINRIKVIQAEKKGERIYPASSSDDYYSKIGSSAC